MPVFNLKNNLDQVISVQYFDLNGVEQVEEIIANGSVAIEAISLHPSAVSQISRGYLSSGQSAQAVAVSLAANLPTFRGQGLIWGGSWVANVVYQKGWVVAYAGQTYVCQTSSVQSSTNPEIDTVNWLLFSIKEPTAFLGVSLDEVPEGGILAKQSGVWVGKQITDANIDEISQDKISGLVGSLATLLPKAGGTMTGFISLHANPTQALHAASKQYVDLRLPLSGGTMTGTLTLKADPVGALQAATKQYVDNNAGVPTTGGTMTGALNLPAAPSQPLQAATKNYVDTFLPKAGGTMTGNLTLNGTPTSGTHATTKTYVDQKALAGGQMTGVLSLYGNPTSANHAANKAYVDLHLPLSGGTMTGPIVANGDPVLGTHLARRSWIETQLGGYLSLQGGSMTGNINVNPPTANAHPATKEYVDSAVAAGGGALMLTGGAMSGAITGSHGLLQLDGSLTMTGSIRPVTLAADANGVYHDSVYNQLAYQNRMLVQRGRVVSVTADYTVAVGVGVVKVDASANSIAITLGDPTTYPASEVLIRRSGNGKYQTVTVRSAEGEGLDTYREELSLNRDGEALIVFPYSTGWEVVNRISPSTLETEIEWNSQIAVDGNNIDMGVDILTRAYEEYAVTGVTDGGGGNASFTISNGLPWDGSGANKICQFTVFGTSSYDGTYEVLSTTSSAVITSDTSHVGSETGYLRGIARTLVTQPRAVAFYLSTSATDPHAGVPTGTSIASVSVGQLLASGDNSRSATIMCRAGGRATFRVNTTSPTATVYLHALPVGEEWGSIRGHSEAVTNAVALADAITAVTDEGGGDIGLTVAASGGWQAGDTATVSGTTSYNNVYTVVSTTATKIVVTATFTGSETGTVTSSEAATVSIARITDVRVNEGARILGVTALNGDADYRGLVERVIGGGIIVRSAITTGTTAGTFEILPVYKITVP